MNHQAKHILDSIMQRVVDGTPPPSPLTTLEICSKIRSTTESTCIDIRGWMDAHATSSHTTDPANITTEKVQTLHSHYMTMCEYVPSLDRIEESLIGTPGTLACIYRSVVVQYHDVLKRISEFYIRMLPIPTTCGDATVCFCQFTDLADEIIQRVVRLRDLCLQYIQIHHLIQTNIRLVTHVHESICNPSAGVIVTSMASHGLHGCTVLECLSGTPDLYRTIGQEFIRTLGYLTTQTYDRAAIHLHYDVPKMSQYIQSIQS